MKQLLHIHFIWGEQGLYMNPGEYKGVFRVNVNHCWEFKVLGMPYLHGEVFQKSLVVVLSGALGGPGHWEGGFSSRKRKLTL